MKQAGGIKVFIRSDVHAVRAGIKLKGQPPLNNPRVFDTLGPLLCSGLLLCWQKRSNNIKYK